MLLEFIDNKDGNNENKEENKKHNLFITLLLGISSDMLNYSIM